MVAACTIREVMKESIRTESQPIYAKKKKKKKKSGLQRDSKRNGCLKKEVCIAMHMMWEMAGSIPGRVIALCFWARQLIFMVSFSTQEYKWVPETVRESLGGGGGGDDSDRRARAKSVSCVSSLSRCFCRLFHN